MNTPTLTTDQAKALYTKGLAILDGTFNLTTRTASYLFNPNTQLYELELNGLRVQHQAGARWNGTRFIRCACDWCSRAHRRDVLVDVHP